MQLLLLANLRKNPAQRVDNARVPENLYTRMAPCQGGGFFFSKGWLHLFFRRVGSTPPSRFLVTVIIFGLLDTKSVNCHRDRGGQGRHPRNCRCFSTLGWCSKLKNVDSYRDRGGQGRHVGNCRRVSTVGQCSKLKNVDSYTDRGRQARHPHNCRRFLTLGCCSTLKNVDSYRDRGKQGRHSRNCPRFWTLTPAWKFKSVDSPFAKHLIR